MNKISSDYKYRWLYLCIILSKPSFYFHGNLFFYFITDIIFIKDVYKFYKNLLKIISALSCVMNIKYVAFKITMVYH